MTRFVFHAADAPPFRTNPAACRPTSSPAATFEARWYAPRGSDPQTPHTRDEAYVVVRGHGMFLCAGQRAPFGAGDMLWVPAGAEHRFEDFSDDLAVWVIFYGPEGGER